MFYLKFFLAKLLRIILQKKKKKKNYKFLFLHKSPPDVLLDYNTSDSKWVFSGGFEVELFKAMSDYFNFTYKIINCNSDWGIRLPNETWTGIIGSVASKVILEKF
jgi:hypothetical protein